MQCLLEGGPATRLEVTIRCLHLVERQPLRLFCGGWEEVDELRYGDVRYLAWEEATEREFTLEHTVGELPEAVHMTVRVPAGRETETLGANALVRRSWRALEGDLELAAATVSPGVVRLSVAFANQAECTAGDRAEALGRTFLSTHLVARCRDGEFVSQTDPPPHLDAHAEVCVNDGVWPVLVGEPGARDTLLGSPIVLADYPSVAAESPGDLFDGGEIDALLIHSIRGLSDAEREEMAASDPRTREILERSLALPGEQMGRLYGAVREMRRVES
jgi:hydrogenase maturation protease